MTAIPHTGILEDRIAADCAAGEIMTVSSPAGAGSLAFLYFDRREVVVSGDGDRLQGMLRRIGNIWVDRKAGAR